MASVLRREPVYDMSRTYIGLETQCKTMFGTWHRLEI
ncbi:hypothetical protein F383_29443 [Gossypium arboreum]|uniref:Uncharacterized protein n=1 Tax=Gossypium arboreum TaxID=29729 RepID=A0A0B0PEE1_GOSAR|nr:hypothetical protein F383_29443 [Gossypium arboreum]